MTCVACLLCTVQAYTLAQYTTHTPHSSLYAAIALTTSAWRLSQLRTTSCNFTRS